MLFFFLLNKFVYDVPDPFGYTKFDVGEFYLVDCLALWGINEKTLGFIFKPFYGDYI